MSILTFVFVGILAFVGTQAEDQEFYPERWLHIDVKPIIDNDRLFKKYTECIVEDITKGCPKEAIQLKNVLPEILETECAKCTPGHVEKGKEAAAYTCQKRPNEFLAGMKKIDPTGEVRKRFEAKFGVVPECENLH